MDSDLDTPSLEQNLTHVRRQNKQTEHAMRGFDPQYEDIVDYILRITHRIWEEGDIGHIYDTYLGTVMVHTGYGTAYGVEEVVSGSIASAAALPNRRLYAKDVLWTGDDERGFHTSHLLVSTGTNTGYSPWGPPTGRRAEFLAIANCFVRENLVVEEWLVRDTAAMVRQLGFDIWEVAKDAAALWSVSVTGETDRLQGQYPPAAYQPQSGDPHEEFIRQLFHDAWNSRHFNRITEKYAEDSSLHVPHHLTLRGVANIRAYHLNFMAMFPDAHMNVEHVYGLESEEGGYRAAVRWRFSGTHARYGWYGKPTDKRVNILGISHVYIVDDKVKEHYMVFDDLAVVMQLVG